MLQAQRAKILAIVFERESFLDKKPHQSGYLQGLSELNIPYFIIRKHDNLTNLFNQ